MKILGIETSCDETAIAVDAATGRLYILSSGALYHTALPPQP